MGDPEYRRLIQKHERQQEDDNVEVVFKGGADEDSATHGWCVLLWLHSECVGILHFVYRLAEHHIQRAEDVIDVGHHLLVRSTCLSDDHGVSLEAAMYFVPGASS